MLNFHLFCLWSVEQCVGLAQSEAAVKEECLRQATFISDTKKVLCVSLVSVFFCSDPINIQLQVYTGEFRWVGLGDITK